MWMRWVLGAAAAILVTAGAVVLFRAQSTGRPALPPIPAAQQSPDPEVAPSDLPEAAPATREERRFNRYDKDRNSMITREEYLASRRKAFAKLDGDGDGRLSFDEWVVRTSDRFAKADRDRDSNLTRIEFATTAPKRRSRAPACVCPPAADATAD